MTVWWAWGWRIGSSRIRGNSPGSQGSSLHVATPLHVAPPSLHVATPSLHVVTPSLHVATPLDTEYNVLRLEAEGTRYRKA